jgi:AcrR family transcriptional regulator
MKAVQTLERKRRKPRQARAVATVEIILEATARVLQRENRTILTTNHIADCAGISIGTLYQYFPHKEAILVALARREIRSIADTITQTIAENSVDCSKDMARRAVRALIAASGKRRRVRRAAFQALVAAGFGHELDGNLDEIAHLVARGTGRFVPQASPPLSPVTLFVLTRAVNGVLAAAAEGSRFLESVEFEDELVRLVRNFLDRRPR